MAGEKMRIKSLRPQAGWRLVLLLLALLIIPQTAFSSVIQGGGLYLPKRLTAGSSDQYRSELNPDAASIYYLSNKNGTTEIFSQNLQQGNPRLLFDNSADVNCPRISPDGKKMLYISYKTDAVGDVCVYDLQKSENRCLTSGKPAEIFAFWFPDNKSIGYVSRQSLHDDLALFRMDISSGKSDLILKQNMSSPSPSPDGIWLTFVPLTRNLSSVGVSFSVEVARHISLLNLKTGMVYTIEMPLPGNSGFPSFSKDGKFLYFSQYLNDTNFDGQIDGNDHSVIFRIPFNRQNPTKISMPQQLTSARWNCQFPYPAANELILTCSHQGSLDIYSLPLTGSIPLQWKANKLDEEIISSRNSWDKMLLLARKLMFAPSNPERIDIYRQMVFLHMSRQEYRSVEFYTRQVSALSGSEEFEHQWAEIVQELVNFYQQEKRLQRGWLNNRFVVAQKKRIERLTNNLKDYTLSAQHFTHMVISQIEGKLGNFEQAMEHIKAVNLAEEKDFYVLMSYVFNQIPFLNLVGEKEKVGADLKLLSSHKSLPLDLRLYYAQRFVKEKTLGKSLQEKQQTVADILSNLDLDESVSEELQVVLTLTGYLLEIGQAAEEEVRKKIFALYKKNKKMVVRKVIIASTLKYAAQKGKDYLLYQFANSWVSWLKKAQSERRYAEKVYLAVILERAYLEIAKKEYKKARASFYGGTLKSNSLEAHTGFIETRFMEGKGVEDILSFYRKQFKNRDNHPVYRYVRAYLIAREFSSLPLLIHRDEQSKPDFDILNFSKERCQQALDYLYLADRDLPRNLSINFLWGFLAHQKYFHRDIDTGAAYTAIQKYLLALDLAREKPRYQAPISHALGLLNAALGNHRAALLHFDSRQKLPFLQKKVNLNLLIARARSLYHTHRPEKAVDTATLALTIVKEEPRMQAYLPMVLDRAGLYFYASKQFDKSIEILNEYLTLIAGAGANDRFPLVNHLKGHILLAANHLLLQQFNQAIEQLKKGEAVLDSGEKMRPVQEKVNNRKSMFRKHQYGREDFQILIAGLLAHAFYGSQDLSAATFRMKQRIELLEERFEEKGRDSDLLEIAQAYSDLATYAFLQKREAESLLMMKSAFNFSDKFNKKTGTIVNQVNIRLLHGYARLWLNGKKTAGENLDDLIRRLQKVHQFLCQKPNPRWKADREMIGFYLTSVRTDTAMTHPQGELK